MFLPSTAKLPEYRIYFEFPFKNVGFDYAGPLYTRNVYSSNKETYKSCYPFFTCAAASNTHLEMVPTESSEISSVLQLMTTYIRIRNACHRYISIPLTSAYYSWWWLRLSLKLKIYKNFILNQKQKKVNYLF